MHRDPRQFGIEGTRWTLADLHRVCEWMQKLTLPGISCLLDRLGISWKQGRAHLHSPDPDYQDKLDYCDDLRRLVRASHGRLALLFLDEFTYYRQPTLAKDYEARGPSRRLAELSYRTNTPTRIVAVLDALTGRTLYRRRKKIGLTTLVHFYQYVREVYADTRRIYVLQDNWPEHFHPDVLVALEPQEHPWPVHRPGNWPTEPNPSAVKRYGGLHLPIQLVPLPTYAPWTNPIEKLWHKAKQEVLHLHRLADKLDELRLEVDRFLDQFANGSLDLLHYVGLPNTG